MIKRDGHMHPNLLKKPHQGREFIERAVELGFEEIVFTDHMPFSVTGDEHDRIPFGKVAEYCEEVRRLAEEYADRIRILTGIEIDYHPECTREIEEVIAAGKFDVILGSTHLDIKGFGIPFDKITRGEFARLVFENYLAAAKSGYFHVMTHLDIYRWIFAAPEKFPLKDDSYVWRDCEDVLRQIFSVMEEKGIALEINAAPFYKGFGDAGAYPERGILELSREYDLRYTFGSDAHFTDKVGYAYGEFERFMDGSKSEE